MSGCAPVGSWQSEQQQADMRAYNASRPGLFGDEAVDRRLPTLIVSDSPPPDVIYRRGLRDTVLSGASSGSINVPPVNTRHIETPVTQKANELSHDLSQLRGSTAESERQLDQLQARNDAGAAEYYALVASINAELQSGSTAGNPILVERWDAAQNKLNAISQDAGLLNGLATDLSNQATRASYLLEATQTAFGLSGAVQEDHDKLNVIEDGVSQNIAQIDRLLTKVNDEIGRRTTYLRAERANLQTLSLGVAKGDLYGQNLTNSLFRKASKDGQALYSASGASAAMPGSRRPLVIIRFDRANVDFDQPLYTAISQAMEKYPSAKFDLVAVSNLEGNAAQLALASAEARKNGESVLRSLQQMGLPLERVRLSAANSKDVLNSEVHIYLQ